MGKLNKTNRVIEAMRMCTGRTTTIGEIRETTGLAAHEIGGILASLERQGRVERAEVENATRNHWRLLRAEKRSRALALADPAALSPSLRRRLEERAREEAANRSAVMLQNIVLGMAFRAAQRTANYAR
jgi:DNA-binding MarR family transcriptional regulator